MSDVVLNNLYKQTPLQSVFGINMVALHEGQPKLLNLKQVLEAFLAHRREVVTRRTIFDLRKARDRAHVLEGQSVALANIDEVIELIKQLAVAGGGQGGLMAADWAPGAVTGMLERRGPRIPGPTISRTASVWSTASTGCPRPGAGHPGSAAAPADRPRARENP